MIIAIGFGDEKTVDTLPQVSYWDNDRIHQARCRGTILVSGTGDGGLVDLLRASLSGFRHDRIVNEFLRLDLLLQGMDPAREGLRRELELLQIRLPEIDREAMTRAAADRNRYITSEYRKLTVPKIDKEIQSRRRQSVTAILNAGDTDALNIDSSILNRFLVSRLLFPADSAAETVRYIPGKIDKASFDGRTYAVTIGDEYLDHIDHIVIRHGPVVSAPASALRWIWTRCAPMRERNQLDQTRKPSWSEGTFTADTSSLLINSSPARDPLVHSFFGLESGTPVFVWPRFRWSGSGDGQSLPSLDQALVEPRDEVKLEDYPPVGARVQNDLTKPAARFLTAEGDWAAMIAVQEIFSAAREQPPAMRFVDEVPDDVSHGTLISVGLYSNQQTVEVLQYALSEKLELRQHEKTGIGLIYLPISLMKYRSGEPDGADYGIIVRTRYRDRTVLLLGGLTERGTRRIGEHLRKAWREIAEG